MNATVDAIIGETTAFFTDDLVWRIALATVILFTMMLITWWVYRSLSEKNLYLMLHPPQHVDHPTFATHALYALHYIILFPLCSFLGFLIFALSLFLIIKPATPQMQASVLFASIVLVSTIRVSAYVNEGLAEDLAKLMPFSMLSFIFTHPSLEALGFSAESFAAFFTFLPSFVKYFMFTILLEVVLRTCAALSGRAGFDPESEVK